MRIKLLPELYHHTTTITTITIMVIMIIAIAVTAATILVPPQ
jgi:hypothetical protein